MFDMQNIHIKEPDYIGYHRAMHVTGVQYFNDLGETIFYYDDHCVVGDYEYYGGWR